MKAACKMKPLKKEVKKHLKEDIHESKESISEDKALLGKLRKKATSGSRRSLSAPKSARKAKY